MVVWRPSAWGQDDGRSRRAASYAQVMNNKSMLLSSKLHPCPTAPSHGPAALDCWALEINAPAGCSLVLVSRRQERAVH
jgi:hypothetical protein